MTAGFEAELELGRVVIPPPTWAAVNEQLQSRPGRLRLALTGGIASGKSTVARMFIDLGAKEIDFDRLAHQAMEPGGRAFAAAAEIFGPEVLAADGRLSRPLIRHAIFNDPEKKTAWEAAVHPETWRMMGEELAALADEAAVILSVPLLFETGLESLFAPVILVFTSPAAQLARLMARNPEMGVDEAQKIIAAQWPVAVKLRGSHHIINNNGSLDETLRQVRELWERLAG